MTNTNIGIVIYRLNKNKRIYQITWSWLYWIESFVALNRIESFSFLANRPSLISSMSSVCSASLSSRGSSIKSVVINTLMRYADCMTDHVEGCPSVCPPMTLLSWCLEHFAIQRHCIWDTQHLQASPENASFCHVNFFPSSLTGFYFVVSFLKCSWSNFYSTTL